MKKSMIIASCMAAGVTAAATLIVSHKKKNRTPDIVVSWTPDYEIIIRDNKYYYRDVEDKNNIRPVTRVYTAYEHDFPCEPNRYENILNSCPYAYDLCCKEFQEEDTGAYNFWKFVD